MRPRPMVGRRAELATLTSRLPKPGGSGSLVLVTGEAGIGKTKLIDQVQAACPAAGVRALVGRCSEVGRNVPYLPFVDAFADAVGDIEELRSMLGEAADYVGAVAPGVARHPLRPASKTAVYEAAAGLLGALAAHHPLLLCIEDVHWADPASIELLEYLSRRTRRMAVLMLVSARTHELARQDVGSVAISSLRRAAELEVTLGPLGPAESKELAANLISGERREHSAAEVARRAQGNPLFIEELASARGQGESTDGVPPTIRELALGRLDRLPSNEKEVIRGAAVLGPDFTALELELVSGGDVGAAIRIALDNNLLAERASGRFAFRHALIWEAVYQSILDPERRRYHSRVAEALIQSSYAQPDTIARHLVSAGRGAQAVPYCLSAGREAEARAAYSSAAQLYLEASTHVAETATRAELRLIAGRCLVVDGAPGEAVAHLAIADQLFSELGDEAGQLATRLELSRATPPLGSWGEAVDASIRALAGKKSSFAYVYLVGQRASRLAEAGLINRASELAEMSNSILAEFIASRTDKPDPLAARLIQLGGPLGVAVAAAHDLNQASANRFESYAKTLAYVAPAVIAIMNDELESVDELGQLIYRAAITMNNPFLALRLLYASSLARCISLKADEALALAPSFEGPQFGSAGRIIARLSEARATLFLGRPREVLIAAAGAIEIIPQSDQETLDGAYLLYGLGLAQAGRLDEARQVLEGIQRLDWQQQYNFPEALLLQLAVDCGHFTSAALRQINRFLGEEVTPTLWKVGAFAAIEAMRLLNRGEEIEALLERRPLKLRLDDPYVQLAIGLGLLTLGEDLRARPLLERAGETFAAAGYADLAARAVLGLAEAEVDGKADETVRARVESTLNGAKARGSLLAAGRARAWLLRQGFAADKPSPLQIKLALENFVALDPNVQERITATLTEVISSASEPDRQAARVALDYYIRRRGTQEEIAEYLYLTRPTFYRRLRRGWDLLAEHIDSLD